MIRATIVSTPDCHLCARAREVLRKVAHGELEINELDWDSAEGRSLVASEGVPFPPAVLVDGRFAAYGRVSEAAMRRHMVAAR